MLLHPGLHPDRCALASNIPVLLPSCLDRSTDTWYYGSRVSFSGSWRSSSLTPIPRTNQAASTRRFGPPFSFEVCLSIAPLQALAVDKGHFG
jgi:hypothetical protein